MSECGVQCVISIIITGFIWGATNPLLRAASRATEKEEPLTNNEGFIEIIVRFFKSFLNWRFSIPFALNQLGSIIFNVLVVYFPVTVVVPCVNAIQFVATMIVGRLLGEKTELSSVKQQLGVAISVFAVIGMLIVD